MFGHRYVYAKQGFIRKSPGNRIYCRHLSMKPPGDVVAVPFPHWASAVALSDAQDCGFGQRPVASEEFATDARPADDRSRHPPPGPGGRGGCQPW
jgi:hypothetical protein